MTTTIKMEPTKAKIKRRSVDWPAFQRNLAKTLEYLTEDQFLLLCRKHSTHYVQFSGQGSYGMRVETTSNFFLDEEERIGTETHLALLTMGWKPPTGDSEEATPENDPDGSPNYFVDFPRGTSCDEIATLAVRTLADIVGVPHPGQLEYESFDSDGNRIEHPALGVKSSPLQKKLSGSLGKLLDAVRSTTGIGNLDYDDDGLIRVTYGCIDVFVCLVGDPSYARFISPLMTDTKMSEGLLAQLNAFNAQANHVCFFWEEESVLAMTDIPANQIVCSNVEMALNNFSRISEEAAIALRAFAGGSTLVIDPPAYSSLQ